MGSPPFFFQWPPASPISLSVALVPLTCLQHCLFCMEKRGEGGFSLCFLLLSHSYRLMSVGCVWHDAVLVSAGVSKQHGKLQACFPLNNNFSSCKMFKDLSRLFIPSPSLTAQSMLSLSHLLASVQPTLTPGLLHHLPQLLHCSSADASRIQDGSFYKHLICHYTLHIIWGWIQLDSSSLIMPFAHPTGKYSFLHFVNSTLAFEQPHLRLQSK